MTRYFLVFAISLFTVFGLTACNRNQEASTTEAPAADAAMPAEAAPAPEAAMPAEAAPAPEAAMPAEAAPVEAAPVEAAPATKE